MNRLSNALLKAGQIILLNISVIVLSIAFCEMTKRINKIEQTLKILQGEKK